MLEFVKNIMTLQTILSNITPVKLYLLKDSWPNFINDLVLIDEKLLVLCMDNVDKVVYTKCYNEFKSILKKINETIVSKESFLAKMIKEVHTDLIKEIKYILDFLKEEMEKKRINLNLVIPKNATDVKVLFHKPLFDIVFREFIFNMCKHSEENANADLIINTNNKETVEISLTHPGKLKCNMSFGTGEEMVKELILAHEGDFVFPYEIKENKIESKIIIKRR